MLNFSIAVILLLGTTSLQASEVVDSTEEKSICGELKGHSDAWYDRTHTYLSIQFCEPAAWFDGFFSDERSDEEYRPGTRVRWKNDFVYTENNDFDYKTKISASFRLPGAKDKINVVFEGEEEESIEDVLPENEEEIKSDFGLLYEIKKNLRANLSLRVKLSPSINLRYRYTVPLENEIITRFTQELYRRDNSYGATSRLDFEKRLNEDFVLRQSNMATIVDNRAGLNWATSLVLFHHLSDVSALSYESSVAGITTPEYYVTNTRLGVRYRRNFFRKWLFYEVAPAVTWPRSLPEIERDQVWEVLFRLEVNFINL